MAGDRRPMLPVMRRALLITAVASSETTLIGVLRRCLYDQGGADSSGPYWDNPELDRRVRSMTRGSIYDWVPRLAAELKMDLPAASCNWAAVTEIWARRHLLVHNGGLADQKYTGRVPGAVPGVLLDVDGEYLRTAIDLLSGFVLSIIFETWARQPGRPGFVARIAGLHAVTAAAELQWPLAENLHQFAARYDPDPEGAATSQVNAWISRMHWRGPQSITADARQWPVSELPKRFALARHILLAQTKQALAMLPALLASGEINGEDLQTWPLFDPMRELPAFQRLLADPPAGPSAAS
jgi:hypothetical protein